MRKKEGRGASSETLDESNTALPIVEAVRYHEIQLIPTS